jgi:DNA-binding LacI/PurR family transcriptional regulator
MSDRVALGVLDHARAAGIPVPGRLSVAGYDDIPAAAASNPPLTTIAQPLREKGRRAAAMIFSDDPPHSELIPVRLVARGSTGPAPR